VALARSGHQNLLVIGVVTDSAAGLPGELAARLGIQVVPLYLSVEGRSLRDGELPNLYERLEREPGSVTTSTPPPAPPRDARASWPRSTPWSNLRRSGRVGWIAALAATDSS